MKKVHIGLNVDEELYEEFKDQADLEHRSMANLLKKIIIQYLGDQNEPARI